MSNLARSTGFAVAAVLVSSCRPVGTPQHMQAHYQRAGIVPSTVIRGDLAQAKDAARWVAEHEQATGMPPAATPYLGQMQSAAGDVARAGTMADAALAAARMGATCGSCHRATNAGVRIAVVTSPEQGAGVTIRMRGHFWAMDRLWDGLVGPSDTSWVAGARLLADPGVYASLLSTTGSNGTEVRTLATQLQALGQRGRTTTGQADRAAIHGEALATCSGCHQLLSVQVE